MLVVPGAGHSVLNHSACAANAVRAWLNGGDPAGRLHEVLPLRPAARRLAQLGRGDAARARVPGPPARTLDALLQTIHDAEDIWLLTRDSQEPMTASSAGGSHPTRRRVRLRATPASAASPSPGTSR